MSRFTQRLAALEASRVPDHDARIAARRFLEAAIRAEAASWGVRDADTDRFVIDVMTELRTGSPAATEEATS